MLWGVLSAASAPIAAACEGELLPTRPVSAEWSEDGTLTLSGGERDVRVTVHGRFSQGPVSLEWTEPEVEVPAGVAVALSPTWPVARLAPEARAWPGTVGVHLVADDADGRRVGEWSIPAETVSLGDRVRIGGDVRELSPVVLPVAADEVVVGVTPSVRGAR